MGLGVTRRAGTEWRRAAPLPLLTLGWIGYDSKTKQAHLVWDVCPVRAACLPASATEAGWRPTRCLRGAVHEGAAPSVVRGDVQLDLTCA